jgi:hypothetical protein
MHMLDAVDVVIALWDGQPARGLGGTAQVIAQAQAIGTPVVQISSSTGAVTGTEALNARFKPDEIIMELNEMARKDQVPCVNEGATKPDSLQDCLDHIAVLEAAHFRPALVWIILMHGVAALLAAIVTFKASKGHPWEDSKWLITAFELGLVSWAWWMGWRLHRKHTQERWIRCRFACEILRGLRTSVPLLDPLHPAIGVHDPKWRRFALSAGLHVNEHQSSADPLTLRDNYLAIRLSETHKEGQIRHYHTMEPKALWWWELTGKIGKWSAILALPFVFLSLLNKLSKNADPEHVGWNLDGNPATWPLVVLLPIALPLLAGVASGIRQALDAGRRKERYPQMVARLTEIKQALPGLQTASSIRRTVTHSEEILLDELIEWQLAVKNTCAH